MIAYAPGTLPPELALRLQRGRAAAQWRRDHAADPDAERLWRAFRTGALRGVARLTPVEQGALRAGLADAERAVPFADGQRSSAEADQPFPSVADDLDADPGPDRSVPIEADEDELADSVDRGLHTPHGAIAADGDRGPVRSGQERLRDGIEQRFVLGH